MPAVTGTPHIYAAGLQKWQRGLLPVQTAGCFKALLVGSSYTPDYEAHTDLTDITNEQYGDSWLQGGVTLTGVDVTLDQANNRTELGFTAISVATASIADGKALVIYHALPPLDADKTLFAYISFATALRPVYGPIAIAAPDGVLRTPYTV